MYFITARVITKKIKQVLLVLVNGVWTNTSPLFTLKCKEQCSKNFCHTIASNQPSNKSLVGSSNSKIKIAGFICLTLQSLKKNDYQTQETLMHSTA